MFLFDIRIVINRVQWVLFIMLKDIPSFHCSNTRHSNEIESIKRSKKNHFHTIRHVSIFIPSSSTPCPFRTIYIDNLDVEGREAPTIKPDIHSICRRRGGGPWPPPSSTALFLSWWRWAKALKSWRTLKKSALKLSTMFSLVSLICIFFVVRALIIKKN